MFKYQAEHQYFECIPTLGKCNIAAKKTDQPNQKNKRANFFTHHRCFSPMWKSGELTPLSESGFLPRKHQPPPSSDSEFQHLPHGNSQLFLVILFLQVGICRGYARKQCAVEGCGYLPSTGRVSKTETENRCFKHAVSMF